MKLTILLAACTVAACHDQGTASPIPYVDAGPYPQATSDVSAPSSAPCPVTADFRAACDSLQKAGCSEGDPDVANRSCPDHLAQVCADKIGIDAACAIRANGDAAAIRKCGTRETLRWRCLAR